MKKITNAGMVSEFAGKIVAFTISKPSCILHSNLNWPIDGLNFGFIGKEMIEWQGIGSSPTELGHNMCIFKKGGRPASACALTTSNIIEAELMMREASLDEIAILKEKHKNGESAFEYIRFPTEF